MVSETLAASAILAEKGINAEVVDLRSLKPLDAGLVIESVKKTGRLVIADTGWKEYGIGAEIAARVFEHGFSFLKAPVGRIALPDAPAPASHVLEAAYYPGKDDIIKAAERAFRYGLE
jgi:pyruvate dehydrogenase E1 component beta subunit